jgi:hypothetical protein
MRGRKDSKAPNTPVGLRIGALHAETVIAPGPGAVSNPVFEIEAVFTDTERRNEF